MYIVQILQCTLLSIPTADPETLTGQKTGRSSDSRGTQSFCGIIFVGLYQQKIYSVLHVKFSTWRSLHARKTHVTLRKFHFQIVWYASVFQNIHCADNYFLSKRISKVYCNSRQQPMAKLVQSLTRSHNVCLCPYVDGSMNLFGPTGWVLEKLCPILFSILFFLILFLYGSGKDRGIAILFNFPLQLVRTSLQENKNRGTS